MPTYRTGDTPGTASPKNLYDDAQDLDLLMTGPLAQYPNRLGKILKSMAGMQTDYANLLSEATSKLNEILENAGYEVLGVYTEGVLTIESKNQLVEYDGNLYKLAAGVNTPYTTKGTDATSWDSEKGNFVAVGDGAYKSELDTQSVIGTNAAFRNVIDELATGRPTRFVAHRGYSTQAPENTVPSYLAAARAGFWGGETDIQCTSDNQWVIMHDGSVDRTTNGTGNIPDLTYEYIKTLDAGLKTNTYWTGTQVPSLKEFLICCKNSGLHPFIEIKSDGVYTEAQLQIALDVCLSVFPDYGFTLISFNTTSLATVRGLDARVTMMLVSYNFTQTEIDFALNYNVGLDIYFDGTVTDFTLALDKGIRMGAWIVDTLDLVYAAERAGIEFITTSKCWRKKQ